MVRVKSRVLKRFQRIARHGWRRLCCLVLVTYSAPALSMDATIAVAANFRETASAIAQQLEAISDHRYQVISGSTGKLVSQIIAGAPYDILMAADQRRPGLLVERGLVMPGSLRTYAIGELGLWWPNATGPVSIQALFELSPDRVGIANPAIAPYGEAAIAVLARSGADPEWVEGMVRVDNVNLVAGMVAAGQIAAGFVARASVHEGARHGGVNISEEDVMWLSDHPEIRQDMVQLARAGRNAAAAFWVEQLKSPEIRAVIKSRGYQLPAEGED